MLVLIQWAWVSQEFFQEGCIFGGATLPETNSSPLQMDGWNTILSYWVSAYFQGL